MSGTIETPSTSSASNRWLLSADRLSNTPSHRDGIDAKKELQYRQLAASVIQEMGEELNRLVKDHRGRM